ncbi:18954_t:CDS:2, partial [Gigaspora margarita]
LSDYIEDIWGRSKFFFSHPVLIPPLSILANRLDIHEKFIISVKSAVMGGMRLIWEEEEMKAWRNDVFIKFLHHPNLAPLKHRPSALYDAFIKVNVLGPKHMLALAQTFY